MRKRIGIVMLCACAISLAACGNQENNQDQEQEKPSKEQVTTETNTNKEETPSDTSKEETIEEPKQEAAIEVNIYSGNENADGLVCTPVTISSLDATQIATQLVNRGVMPADVNVLSFKEGTLEGEKVLELDLSSTFLSYLQGRGSAGEYITMGSICNTYLEAYGVNKMKITVEGAAFETGHTEYNRYMSKFSFE